MTYSNQKSITEAREAVLANACGKLIKNLRGLDPVHYYLFFEFGEMAAIYDQVTKIIDNYFAIGTMNFACTGEAILRWNRKPHIAVDLEFFSNGIFIFFRLYLTTTHPRVEIHNILFQESANHPQANTIALEDTLRNAIL